MNYKKKFTNNLYLFYRLLVTSQYNDPVPAPHIKVLANKLMKLTAGESKNRLAVSMPPRHSKSSMVTVAYPLWLILQNPNLKILIVAGSGLAEKFGIMIRDYVERFGPEFGVYLSDVRYSNTNIMFCDKHKKLYSGSIKLTTQGGGITGQDADYLIVDDPYKGQDEEFTPSALQKKIDWANRVIEQRIEPHTKYCILHTRWHTNDLIGYYKHNQAEDFDFIVFPALLHNNQPLWKQRYSQQDILRKKEKLPARVFSGIYQQKPLDTTSYFFKMENVKYKPLPRKEEILFTIRGWDIASSNKLSDGDFSAGVKMGVTTNGNYVITDLVHGKFGTQTKEVIKQTAKKDTVKTPIGIEPGVAAAAKLLFKEWEDQLTGYNLEKFEPINSKEDRATPLSNTIFDSKLYVDLPDIELKDKLEMEFNSFPLGEHDDIVDAAAHSFNWLKYHKDEVCTPDLLFVDI